MRKRSLAIWPLLAPKPKAVVAAVRMPEKYNQEAEKFHHAKTEAESPQEMMQRLAPGFDIKRLVL